MFEEMDYLQEGRNAELFAELYCGSGLIKAPRIFWQFTSHGVLTMEVSKPARPNPCTACMRLA